MTGLVPAEQGDWRDLPMNYKKIALPGSGRQPVGTHIGDVAKDEIAAVSRKGREPTWQSTQQCPVA